MFNLNQLDLNLLRVFVAVMETRSITRAGEKLGLSQSAVSHALNKLRRFCDDPLFLRTPGEMRPTPRATAMAPVLAAALIELESAFGPPEFDPRDSRLQFSIAASDYIAAALFPPLLERFRDGKVTAGLSLRATADINLTEALDCGRLHLAIGMFRKPAARFIVEPIASLDNVWTMRRDHPAAARPLDLETLARFPHLDLRLAEGPAQEDVERDVQAGNIALLEGLLAQRGLTRRIGAVTSHIGAVGAMLARSDLLAFIPASMAEDYRRAYGLVSSPPPYDAEPAMLGLISHRTLGAHPALVWLRRQLVDIAGDNIFAGPRPAHPLEIEEK